MNYHIAGTLGEQMAASFQIDLCSAFSLTEERSRPTVVYLPRSLGSSRICLTDEACSSYHRVNLCSYLLT